MLYSFSKTVTFFLIRRERKISTATKRHKSATKKTKKMFQDTPNSEGRNVSPGDGVGFAALYQGVIIHTLDGNGGYRYQNGLMGGYVIPMVFANKADCKEWHEEVQGLKRYFSDRLMEDDATDHQRTQWIALCHRFCCKWEIKAFPMDVRTMVHTVQTQMGMATTDFGHEFGSIDFNGPAPIRNAEEPVFVTKHTVP